MMKYSPYLLLTLIFLGACARSTTNENTEPLEGEGVYVEYSNPPAEGFNQEGSDLLATLLADKVMNAMGGRKAWDETRYLSWNFFGRRKHVWDKWEGNIRVEEPSKNLVILMNIHTKEGKVSRNGQELTNADSLTKYLDRGERLWINDSYWLVMPFKLKDSGVTLTYVGEDSTEANTFSDVVRLSFENTGVTPENVYDVWIDTETKLITQWAYYKDVTQEEPGLVNSWGGYKQYGNILLASYRGDRELPDIRVLEEVPAGTFDSFEEVVFP